MLHRLDSWSGTVCMKTPIGSGISSGAIP
jgi:hypothetical protein